MFNEIYSIKMRKLLIIFSIFLIATLAISTIEIATAADKTITPNTPGGLNEAIKTANDGDTIYLTNGVYRSGHTNNDYVNKNINIIGGSDVVIDGQGKDKFFYFGVDKKVLLKNIKFTRGYTDDYHEGLIESYCDLTVINCTFTNNNAKQYGVIFSQGDRLTVINCTFTNNKAVLGGAIYNSGHMTVSKSTFTNNKASFGGAIHSINRVTVNSCTFKNNQAGYGGAIECSSRLTVSKSTFINNKALKIFGGAIDSHLQPTTVSSCTFINNKASIGGAIYSYHTLTVSKSTFTKNYAKKSGGAIGTGKGISKIVNSKFTNNIAGKKYNAIYSSFLKKPSLKNVKITPKEGTKVRR